MQLYALDAERKPLFAKNARKHQDYFCMECHSKVRLRGGIHRQSHFYHIEANRACRQNGKGMEHLQTQYRIMNLLPDGEAALEYRFPEIGRIADVVWLSKKIVFEIQYSPIKAQEIEQRNRDYQKSGFRVVWILHERQFNTWRQTGAEQFLLGKPHYYTSINADGEGEIYDQFHLVHEGRKYYSSEKLSVSLGDFRFKKERPLIGIPQAVKQKVQPLSFHFKGDLADLCLASAQPGHLFSEVLEMERALKPQRVSWHEKAMGYINGWIVRPYKLIFQILLERSCR